MSQFNNNNNINLRAILEAMFVFLVLFFMIITTIVFYDFSKIDVGALSFILAIGFAILLAKSIYDVSSGDDKHKKIVDRNIEELVFKPSQKLFAEVYNNSHVAYLILNKDGLVISSNVAANRILGRSAVRLNRVSFFSCIDASRNEHLILLSEKFRNGVTISDEELEIIRPNGIAWATLSILRFIDTTGEEIGLVTLVDITKQKEIDAAKSEFVSLASHQLRTPIAGMRWSAELLLLDGVETLSKQQRRYVDRLLSNIRRMGNLIDDFLQVSRFDLGTRIIQPEKVDIIELLNDVVAEQTVVADVKKIRIEKAYDDSVREIMTDKNLLRMIMTNLYTNAIKYSRSEGQVGISYHKEGGNLFFDIKDSGMGIPVAEQSKIFTKVFRASNAVREVPDGTGLGLYIVKKATQVLQGRVSFNSVEDIGTTFTVVIPIGD